MRLAVTNIGRIVSGDWQQPRLQGDTVVCADGLIASVGTASAQDVESADVVIDAGGTTLVPGLIDSHVHITFGDYTPRQRTVGYLESYLHGGTTTAISASEVHVPGRPKDVDGVKALAIAARKCFADYRPGGMTVHAGSVILEPGLKDRDFADLKRQGVWLAKAGFGGFQSAFDYARRQAHDELLKGERRYRQLVEAVVDYAIFQLDPMGNVTTWNPGAQRIKGYDPEEIIGRHFSRFYTPEDIQLGVPKLALAEAAKQGRFEAEGWRMRKDGSRFWASVVIDRITDEAGDLVGFAKVTRDVTDRKQAQDELQHVQQQLLASQKLEAVGQLSGGIAHDFNNLLMIVLGNLETAERNSRDLASVNLQRALANAKRGAQRAAALTSRLLAFSRGQALDPKPINLNNFLNGLQDFLQRTLGERIEVQTVGSAGLWSIEVDANHLESAIINLGINARDAMPGGGKLTVEAVNVSADEDYCRVNPELSPGQYVTLCITDTGTGMTADILNHAFEPFFTTKEPGQGTGLGLSQVYGFVKQSGGHVKIYSEVGQGTGIRMYFPRHYGNARPADSDTDEFVPEGEKVETILVVEDDADLRAYVSDLLRDLNYRIFTASSAQAAMTILLQDEPTIDLLLTDVVMPGINGRELGRRAQQARPGIKILYMTGYSRNAVVHQGRLDEGVELLEKPISQAKLALRVREMLDRLGPES